MSINDTMARLRELAKVIHKGDWNGYDTGHTIEVFGSIPVLLDYIGELEATIAKHERREDEHCRQIEKLKGDKNLLLDKIEQSKAAREGGAMEENLKYNDNDICPGCGEPMYRCVCRGC